MPKTPRGRRWCACCSKPVTVKDSFGADGRYGRSGSNARYCSDCGNPSNIEYSVDAMDGSERIFQAFDAAAGFAVSLAVCDGETHNIDILVYSRAAAYASGCVQDYDADPDASVTKRVEINATDCGGVF